MLDPVSRPLVLASLVMTTGCSILLGSGDDDGAGDADSGVTDGRSPPDGGVPPQLDEARSAVLATGTGTWNHTVGNGATMALIAIAGADGVTPTSVTLGNKAAISLQSGTQDLVTLTVYYVADPPSGEGVVSVVTSSTAAHVGLSLTFFDSATAIPDQRVANGSTADATAENPGRARDLVIGFVGVDAMADVDSPEPAVQDSTVGVRGFAALFPQSTELAVSLSETAPWVFLGVALSPR